MLEVSKTKIPTPASWGRGAGALPACRGHPHPYPYQRQNQYLGAPSRSPALLGTQSADRAENRTTSPHLGEEKMSNRTLPKKKKKGERKEKEKNV